MRVAIIGTGAMGSLMAATLCREHDVVMVGRWQEQVTVIREHGLKLIDPAGIHSNLSIEVTSDPATIAGQFDIALIAVKSAQTAQAAQDARMALVQPGLGISIQNGLGNLAVVQRELGIERSTLAVTSQGATMVAPGTVRHAGHGLTTIGRLPELGVTQDDLILALCDSFNRCGWPCTVEGDLDLIVWTKLAVNAAINPLTAILGITNGRLLERPEWVTIMSAAAVEVSAVANATGVALEREQAIENAMTVARNTAENSSSMLQDVQRGVPTEIRAITGEAVDEARRLGIAAPVNETLLYLVEQINDGQPDPDAAKVLDDLAHSLNFVHDHVSESHV